MQSGGNSRKANHRTNPPQLVEIPASIFASIEDAPVEAFASDGPRVPCRVDRKQVATVALDRSDAKVTVSGIKLSACIVHVEWRKQQESQSPDQSTPAC